MSYGGYLRSSHWRKRRRSFYRSTRTKYCLICGSDPPLQLHHLSYKRLGREPNEHLVALCDGCHVAVHKRVRSEPGLPLHDAAHKMRKESAAKRGWTRDSWWQPKGVS